MGIIDSIISKAVEQAALTAEFENCFKDNNGIFVCRACGKKKQFKFKGRLIACQCLCDQQREKEEKDRLKREQRIRRLIEIGVTDKRYLANTFDTDKGYNPELSIKCQKYVKKWAEMKKNNIGILFYGDVGAGKSFLACCIGNALINKGVPVLITNLSKLVTNRVQSNMKQEEPINLHQFQLLIIDDLGIENATQTAYNIIDEWYRTDKPLIVTTNLSPQEIKTAKDIDRRRIYDRIIEMCGSIPIYVKGEHRRYNISKQKRALAESLLND